MWLPTPSFLFALPFFFTNWREYSGGDVVARLVEREKVQTVVVVGEKATTTKVDPGVARVDLSLRRVYTNSVRRERVVPGFHPHSRFHYQFVYYSHYWKKLSYADFCLMEENLFDIVKALNEDSRASRRPVLYVFSSPLWLYDESLPSFMTKSEYEHMHRVLHLSPSGEEEAYPRFVEERSVDINSRDKYL